MKRLLTLATLIVGVAVQKVDVDNPQLPALFGISDFHTINELFKQGLTPSSSMVRRLS